MRALGLIALAGCSFVGVRAPSKRIDPATMRPDQIHCNDNSILPALDALGGAGMLFGTGAGIVLEHTTDKDRYDHFTLYYAGPALALAVIYFYSASFGNERVSRCSDLKEIAGRTQTIVRPVGDNDAEQPRAKPRGDDDGIEIH